MVEVLDAAGVEVLHHIQVTCVRPVLDLNLCLRTLLHAIHEHSAEVLALRCEDGLVSVDRLLLNQENDISKSWIVDDRAHVDYQVRHGLVIDLILFELADVEDANVVQPLAAVESTEDEQLLCADYACGVALAARRSFLKFERVRPTHGLGIEYVQIV